MGVWFTNVLMRAEQLTAWLAHGRPNAFWLTGFFNPQGFLTANRQEVCRGHAKANWALDDVVNHTEVLKMESEEVKKPPEEGSTCVASSSTAAAGTRRATSWPTRRPRCSTRRCPCST